MKFSIIIHGGAGKGNKEIFKIIEKKCRINNLEELYYKSLDECINIGKNMLMNGSNAIDVVTECISYLEDNELFNAGKGAVKDFNLEIFHDSCIVDGKTGNWGATCLTNIIKNPIKLSKKIMDTKSTLIGGNKNVINLAQKNNLNIVDKAYFKSNYRKQVSKIYEDLGTVGAVVFDSYGNIATGTSTGGRQNKIPGRIGDSALIGISTIAENKSLGISCTGNGEEIIKNHTASQILYRYKFNKSNLKDSIDLTLKQFDENSSCGIIGLNKNGKCYFKSNTERFYIGLYEKNNNITKKIINIFN